eukprot:gene2968-12977_t
MTADAGFPCITSPATLPLRLMDICRQVALCQKAYELLHPMLDMEQQLVPLTQIEMPVVSVLVGMEEVGMCLDPNVFISQRGPLEKRLGQLELNAFRQAGCKFNMASPKEVSTLLFNSLNLPVPPNAKQLKNGQYSTSADVLQELIGQHPVVATILEHRRLAKLLSSFVETPSAATSAMATDGSSVCHLGALAMGPGGAPIVDKRGSRPHRPGREARGSQHAGPPGHPPRKTAGRRRGGALAGPQGSLPGAGGRGVSVEQRSHAKRLAYGLLYGMGPMALASDMGTTPAEAANLADAFRKSMPGLDNWLQQAVQSCKRQGYIETLMHRRRHLPHINQQGGARALAVRAQGERQAVNSICQGSAADIVKVCMAQLHQHLSRTEESQKMGRMILMVHDELVFEVQSDHVHTVAALVKEVMERAVPLRVPLPIKMHVGHSWGQLSEYTVGS